MVNSVESLKYNTAFMDKLHFTKALYEYCDIVDIEITL